MHWWRLIKCFGLRLLNSPYFCVFKCARAVKQKVWNEAENRGSRASRALDSYGMLYRFLYWFLEKTRLFCSLFWSKRCFTLLIWHKLDKREDEILFMWSLKLNVASIYIPSKVMGKSKSAGTFCSIWRVPIKGNVVLSGLIRRLVFWQHHEANSSGLRLFFELPRRCPRLRACLHGGGGPQIGEVTCGGSLHLLCKRDQIKTRDYVDRQVTPPKWVPSPTWGPPPPCKQALRMIDVTWNLS